MRGWVTALILLSACRGHAAPETPACAAAVEPVPGLRVERAAGPGGCVTLVRIDPRRFRLRLLTALNDGGSRGAPDWAHDFALTGLINASMYAPDQRSIGMLVAGPTVNRERDNEKLGAFLAFDPVDAGDPPLA